MKTKKLIVPLSLSLTTACSPHTARTHDAEEPLKTVLMADDAGCHVDDMQQFGRYLGDWDIQDWQLQKDGSWAEKNGARLTQTRDRRCIVGGHISFKYA